MSLPKPTEVTKLWGTEQVFANNDLYCGKRLIMQQGFSSSIHYHLRKHETMVGEMGQVQVRVWKTGDLSALGDCDIFTLSFNSILTLPPLTPHQFLTPERSGSFLEFSTPHDDEDVVRIKESAAL